jgi:hypothetical protein
VGKEAVKDGTDMQQSAVDEESGRRGSERFDAIIYLLHNYVDGLLL